MNFTSPGLWSVCLVFTRLCSSPYAGIGLSVTLQSWGTQRVDLQDETLSHKVASQRTKRGAEMVIYKVPKGGASCSGFQGRLEWGWRDGSQRTHCNSASVLTQRGHEALPLDLSQAQKTQAPWHPSQNAPTLLCQIKKGPAIYATETDILIIKVKPKIQFYQLVANYWATQRVNFYITRESSVGCADKEKKKRKRKHLAGDADPVNISLGSKTMGILNWEIMKAILIWKISK